MDPIPNMCAVIESKDYPSYKEQHPEVKLFQYPQVMKRAWQQGVDEQLEPLADELR